MRRSRRRPASRRNSALKPMSSARSTPQNQSFSSWRCRGKLDAAIEAQAGFAQEFGAEAHVFGAIDAPEPELFFVALQEIDGFLEFFHGLIEIGGQKKDSEQPSVARIAYADAHAVLAALVAFDRTPIIIANC